MTDLLNAKNTLNITYNYDKTDQRTGYFTLDLRQDNKTYVPKQLNADSVTYYKEGGYEIKTWPAKLARGKIVLQATDFHDLRKAGTYVIRATVDGIIFPSQGKCTLTLNGDFSADAPIETQVIAGHDGADGASITNVNVDENGLMTFTLDNGKTFTSQIKIPETVKGDRGDKGSDGLSAYQLAQQAGFKGSLEEWLQSLKGKDGLAGKNAAEITNATITGKTLTFKLSDNSSYSVELPLLKGDKGDDGLAGKNAPTIINATIDNNTLTFTMSDGTKHSVVLPLLKGDRGEAGLAGKDAPKITNVTLNGNALTFDLSDSSTYSVNLPLLKGDRGEAGLAGKDAPKITNVTLNDNALTFDLSDGSSYSVVLPLLKGDRGDKGENGLSAYQIAQQAGFHGTETEWLQSLKGQKGDTGLPGKDAPKITGVTLNDDQTQIIFNMSDGTQLESSFKAPTAIPGKDGKDAPKITDVSYQENKLIFTLSDGSSISATLPDLTGPAGQKGSDGLSAYQIAVKDGFKGSEQDWLQSLKGQKGDVGLAGQNAPKITSVKFENGQLTFTLSDSSTISTPLTLPKGDKGSDGKDAPKFTNVNYQNGELIFTLSDKSTLSVPLTLPKGDNGLNGKDAPKITNVTLNGNTLTFDLSDSTSYSLTLPLLKGDKGDTGSSGKDAPKITKASYTDGTLTFTLSDNSTISTALPVLTGPKGDKGSDGLSAYQIAVKDGFKGNEQDWLNSLKGETGPAGKDGTGTKLKAVFYDSTKNKAVFLNADETLIESNIFSDTNLPANPENLTNAYLTSDSNQKPSLLLPGETDLKIPISFNMHNESPTSTGSSLDSIDLHLNTYPLTAHFVNSLELNDLQSVKDNADNLRFNLQSACLSNDKHTLYAKVSLYPFYDGQKTIFPVFYFFNEPWHKRNESLSFNSLFGYSQNTDGETPLTSLSTISFGTFNQYDSFTFVNTLGSDLIVFHSDSITPVIYKPDYSVWNLESGVETPINLDFTVSVE